MKKGNSIRQAIDILLKIAFAFIIVFVFYFVCKIIGSFAYNYFIFPLVSITIIFICGVNVGRSLEKLKTNDPIGFFTRKNKNVETTNELYEKTEFTIQDTYRVVENKKILKEVAEGDKIHIKVFNYNDIINDAESGNGD